MTLLSVSAAGVIIFALVISPSLALADTPATGQPASVGDPKASSAGSKGANSDACVYGWETPDKPDESRVIYGCKYSFVTKYVIGGDSSSQGAQGGASAGGFLAYSVVPIQPAVDDQGNKKHGPAGELLYDLTQAIYRVGVVATGTYGSGTKASTATPATSTTSTSSANSTPMTLTSLVQRLSFDVGVGVHVEFPDTNMPLIDLLGIQSPLALGVVVGKSYSFDKTDPTNGHTWVGVSIGTFF